MSDITTENSIVRARGVCKSFGEREVVCGLDFDIPAGVCFGILGPNGAGKTTLMRMLVGMSPVTSGEYTLFGEPVSNTSLHHRLGVVPQQDNLDPDFTVLKNLMVYANYFGISKAEAASRGAKLLDFASLASRADDAVTSLSGGMRRRLMIARALVNNPDLVVLDEPTTGLDPQARHLIWQRLRSLKNQGTTLILTTHYMEEAAELCDELMVLDHGKILDRGTPRELIQRHVEPEVVAIRGLEHNDEIEQLTDGLEARFEQVGDTWFCYMMDARELVSRCAGHEKLIFIHRPASLEDVFLKLTGRDLREES